MSKYVPPSFDQARVLDGLHKAMGFGEPTRSDDKATFYKVAVTVTAPSDQEGIPFNPVAARTKIPTGLAVACAIEYADVSDTVESFGAIQPSQITITLLDPDYQLIKGFDYVLAGGDRYFYRDTEPPVALGSIDVWTVRATAQDER